MWDDDRHWFPFLLEDRPFPGRFVFEGERLDWGDIQPDVGW